MANSPLQALIGTRFDWRGCTRVFPAEELSELPEHWPALQAYLKGTLGLSAVQIPVGFWTSTDVDHLPCNIPKELCPGTYCLLGGEYIAAPAVDCALYEPICEPAEKYTSYMLVVRTCKI